MVTARTLPGRTPAPPEPRSKEERHVDKVVMLSQALQTRYGHRAFDFVAKQVDGSDEANRATWLAVLASLSG